ncbi:MAG: response regulator [Leptolyngbyaceae bacterium]|nr:response regulator [Leptolyngbyaceae bacterium]
MKRILVIEDEAQVRNNIKRILELEDFFVIAAENGRIGLALAQDTVPDLIICDVMMPEMDGYEVLEALKQNPSTATIPWIFLTAKAEKNDLRQGMELGADDYLTKPFLPGELLKAIATQFAKKAALDRQIQTKLDQLRSSITLSLPHELHTPLNGILGCAEVLIEDYGVMDDAEKLDMLDGIYTSAKRLHRLTKNFLLYAQLELIASNPERMAALRKNRDRAHPRTLVQEVATEIAQQAERTADLTLDLPDLTVQMPDNYLRKIIDEVVDNAFKFSTPGTPVRIVGNLSDRTFSIFVMDQGRGLTPEQLASIGGYMQFDRQLFEQQGVGLGLLIAKRLTELHGGELTLESILNKQTIVRIVLPS